MVKINPDSFFSDAPPPRIIGTECEYEIQTGARQQGNTGEFIQKTGLRSAGLKSVGGYLSNGGRLYLDVGEHLEYGTPECLGPRQAAAADVAGAYIMQRIVEGSKREHNGLYRNAGTYLVHTRIEDGKTEVISNGSSRGYHENYMFPRRVSDDPALDTVMPSFLATRLWAMSGTLRSSFVYSQKVWGLGGDPVERQIARRTQHGNKPMIIIPPANKDSDVLGCHQWARLEVRFADPGLSPTVRYLGLAATSLVLRMIEHKDVVGKDFLHGLEFRDPMAAAKMFADDLTLSRTADTEEGKQYTAMDVQEALADTAIWLSQTIDLPQDEAEAAVRWYGIIERMKAANPADSDWGNLIYELDVAAKHNYLARNHSRVEQNRENPDAVQRAFTWDRVLPRGGGMIWWEKFPSEAVAPESIEELLTGVPGTRASIRAAEIRGNRGEITGANWTMVSFKKGPVKKFLDPYES